MLLYILSFLWCSGCSIVGFEESSHYRYVQVDRDHLSTKLLLHSLFHILGRYHEHQREDREEYIRIIKEHIIEGNNNLVQGKPLFVVWSGQLRSNIKGIFVSRSEEKGHIVQTSIWLIDMLWKYKKPAIFLCMFRHHSCLDLLCAYI